MIGFKENFAVTGSKLRGVEEIASSYGSEMIRNMRKIGLDMVPTDNQRLLSEMTTEVIEHFGDKPDRIFIAHSLPFIVGNEQREKQIRNIPITYFSGIPCVIMHRAVMIAKRMIAKGICSRILVIGADKAYSDQERIFFGTIMGDAAVGILVSDDCESSVILNQVIRTRVIADRGEESDEADIKAFRKQNGAAVRSAMEECLKGEGIQWGDLRYVVPHTSNSRFWDGMAEITKLKREQFLDDNIRNTGHFNSHDSFYHYFYYKDKGMFHSGELVMLVNPGFGGTQGCTLVRC